VAPVIFIFRIIRMLFKTQQTLKFQIRIDRNFFHYRPDYLLLPIALNKNFHRISDYLRTSKKILRHIFIDDNMIQVFQSLLISVNDWKTENGKKIGIYKFGVGLKLFVAIS